MFALAQHFVVGTIDNALSLRLCQNAHVQGIICVSVNISNPGTYAAAAASNAVHVVAWSLLPCSIASKNRGMRFSVAALDWRKMHAGKIALLLLLFFYSTVLN